MAADTIDLKDRIKELKARKAEILSERLVFEQELQDYESKLNQFKQELNVIGALDELRFAVLPSGDGDSCAVLNSKEKEINRKLELQCLIPDIKAALPLLETQALEWEEYAHNHDMESIRAEKDGKMLPQTILRSSEEIRQEIESVLDRLIQTKALVARDIEAKKQIKLSIASDIRHLRDQLRMAEDDVAGVHMRALRSKMSYEAEEARVEVLVAEQSRLRQEICNYYHEIERGWQTEAFISHTGEFLKYDCYTVA